MPPQESPVLPPVQPPQPFFRNRRVLISLAAIAVLLVIGAACWFYFMPAASGTVPPELSTAVFLGPSSEGKAYVVGSSGLIQLNAAGTKVMYASRGATHVAFVTVDASGTYSFIIDNSIIATSSMPMQNIALSADGSKAAIALQKSGSPESSSPDDWRVRVFDLKYPTARTDIGSGFSPFFLGDSHLVYFATTGLRFHDLVDASDFVANLTLFPSVQTQTFQSPDHKLLGWISPVQQLTVVMAVQHVSPPELTLVRNGSTTPFAQVALGNAALYEVRQEGGRSEVWKRTPQHPLPVRIYVFPAGIDIRRLVF